MSDRNQRPDSQADSTLPAHTGPSQQNRNPAEADPASMWRWVEAVLRSLQGSTTELSSFAKEMELTRSRTVDQQQKENFFRLVRSQMANDPALTGIPTHIAQAVVERAYDELLGISVLGPLWRDDSVTEILVDGWDRVRVEQEGKIVQTSIRFKDLRHATDVARRLAEKVSDRSLTPTQPNVTAELPGARVTMLIDRIVKTKIAIALRKFKPLLGMEKLLEYESLTPEMSEFLADCVAAQANILVSGGTGTGKTSLINALAEFIPTQERVLTIEDSYELSLPIPNWLALQSLTKASADDQVSIRLPDLLVESLRMRPDRIIVGEIRQPEAASVMLEAANTGHEGTMTTVHTASASRAMNFRLPNWVMSAGNMTHDTAVAEVANAFQLVVQVARHKKSGRRYISEIAEVDIDYVNDGVCVPNMIYTARRKRGDEGPDIIYEKTGSVSRNTELGMKLADHDIERWFSDSAE
jgi:pilus assembly protein CpaF